MKRLTEELIERYHDGELGPKERERVEDLLERSPAWRRSLEGVARLRSLLCLMNEESLGNVSFEGFAKRVANGIVREPRPGVGERIRVLAEEIFQHRRAIWVPCAAVVAAAAAVLLVLPFAASAPPRPASSGTEGGTWMAAAEIVPAAGGSRIESVDFGGAAGMVYDVNDGRGGTAGVVWIVEK